jgi:gamma-glutamyltranspeptidase/glutathione hydrolase
MLHDMERQTWKPRGHRIAGLLAVLAATACHGAAFPEAWPYSDSDEPVRASHGMVVSTDSIASQVGVDILRAGGNAVDAAVAVQFALAVVNPEAGNIGGGGFLVLHWADGTSAALDFREKAPLAATRDMYLDGNGEPTDASLVGHLASGVPGSVAGMWAAHRLYGALDWADLVEPAIGLADGFVVGTRFARALGPRMVESLRRFPTSAAQFLPRDGEPPLIGDTLRQPDLGRTLRRIQELGPDGFYRGETADLIVAEMERGGGIITHQDLDAYEAVWRDPISFTYRGHTIVSMPPSSSGGATMAEIANILERYDLASMGWHSSESIHLYAEAFRRAYADRNYYLGDPDFVRQPLDRMTSIAYADERARTIDPARATPSTEVDPGLGPAGPEGPNTTHYSIVDEDGNAVAVTTTLNALYGS